VSRLDGLDWRRAGRRIANLAALAWFFEYSAILVGMMGNFLGGDAILYAKAAHAWLTGGDPWHATVIWPAGNTVFFLAPPPTLIAFAPVAFLPAAFAGAFWVAADVISVVFIVRRLRRPWWWVMFPPAIEATLAGNPEPVMLALLLLGGTQASAAAMLLKPYAAAALVAGRRWRSLAVAAAVGLASVLLLPWGTFIREFGWIHQMLARQLVTGDHSAWANPILLPVAVLALCTLGWRRAWWLAIPVLWPQSQFHYAVIALPALSPLMAIGFSMPLPGSSAVAVIAAAYLVWVRWASRALAGLARAGVGPLVRDFGVKVRSGVLVRGAPGGSPPGAAPSPVGSRPIG
jgi:hypothetical protein